MFLVLKVHFVTINHFKIGDNSSNTFKHKRPNCNILQSLSPLSFCYCSPIHLTKLIILWPYTSILLNHMCLEIANNDQSSCNTKQIQNWVGIKFQTYYNTKTWHLWLKKSSHMCHLWLELTTWLLSPNDHVINHISCICHNHSNNYGSPWL
jgi:hypothetical protein